MKQIRFSDHSQERILARKLNTELIEFVVRNPEQIVPDEDDEEREIYQSFFIDANGKEKLLRVVVEETATELVIISAYPTSQIKKYWKEEL